MIYDEYRGRCDPCNLDFAARQHDEVLYKVRDHLLDVHPDLVKENAAGLELPAAAEALARPGIKGFKAP